VHCAVAWHYSEEKNILLPKPTPCLLCGHDLAVTMSSFKFIGLVDIWMSLALLRWFRFWKMRSLYEFL
jgi:hypothetical protein